MQKLSKNLLHFCLSICLSAEGPRPFYCLQSETMGSLNSSLQFFSYLLTILKCCPLDSPCEVVFLFYEGGELKNKTKHREPHWSSCGLRKTSAHTSPRSRKLKGAKVKKKKNSKRRRNGRHHTILDYHILYRIKKPSGCSTMHDTSRLESLLLAMLSRKHASLTGPSSSNPQGTTESRAHRWGIDSFTQLSFPPPVPSELPTPGSFTKLGNT